MCEQGGKLVMGIGLLQLLPPRLALLPQRGRAVGVEQHGLCCALHAVGSCVFGGVFFEDDVEVGAPEAERTDPGAAWHVALAAYPWARFGVEVEGRVFDAEAWVGARHVDRWGEHFVVQCEGCLDQASSTGSGFGVPDL